MQTYSESGDQILVPPESEYPIPKTYPKSKKPIPEYKAYVRQGFDNDNEDAFIALMPAPKEHVNEAAIARLREKFRKAQRAEENIKEINNYMKETAAEAIRLAQIVYKTTEENSIKEATINELSGKLKGLEEDAKNTLSEIQDLKGQLDELETYKAAAQTENAELNNQIVALQTDIATKTNEFNELNQTYQAALDQINQLKQNIEQNNADIEEYKNRQYTANEEITKAKANLAKLQEEFEQAKKQYNELFINLEQAKKDNETLQRKITVAGFNNKDLESRLDKVSGAFRAEQAKNDDLEAKYKTLDESYSGLKNDYRVVRGENEKNERENATLREQLTSADLEKGVLKTSNKLLNDRVRALVDNVKGLEANAKIREALVNDLSKQAKESEGLRNQLIQVTGERDNAVLFRNLAVEEAVQRANLSSQQQYEKDINKLSKDLLGSKGKNKKLKEQLITAGAEKQVALEKQKRAYLSDINALNDKHFADIEALNRQRAADQAKFEKTLFEQEGLRAAAIQDKIALEKEIQNKVKQIDQLKQKEEELKDTQLALKRLKDKFGDRDLLQKQIADYEEQKIELQNEIKLHKENLSKLRKADKQIDSSLPPGFDLFGPAPARQNRSRRTNPNSLFPLPSYSFPPPPYYSPPPPASYNPPPPASYYSPPPPPPQSYYSPPPPPNYNPAPPTYLPKWPEEPNKLTLEIKVAGGEGGTRAGLNSNLSPVSGPKGDIISKLPFGPYGIEIFQPEGFRKMDTKQDKKKGKKQPTPFQIARSVGKSLFRNLDPLRIRKTSVGTDTTYHAIEKTPEIFETFGRSTKRRKVTRIY